MSKISSMMDVGKRSMMNSQTGLQTVGHNIANKSTEGFSRQRVEQQSNPSVGSGQIRIGMGAKTSAVTRVNNPFLEKQIQRETSHLGMSEGKAKTLVRVEEIYNEQMSKGLNRYVGDFFNAYREMAVNPESLAAKTLVKEAGFYLSKDFHRVNEQLKTLQNDIDQQIKAHMDELNEMSSEIAKLNEKIQLAELSGADANDERDRRELILKKMGQKINIRISENDQGHINVTAGNSAILVSGYSSFDLSIKPTEAREGKREGCVDIFYALDKESEPFRITNQINGGEIGGILQVRDTVINDLLLEVDRMAFSLSKEVNSLHRQGFSQRGTGYDFFEEPSQVYNAAEFLTVSDRIMKDVGFIASAADSHAPGDNRIANAIASLQYEKIMNQGLSSIDDFYSTMVGRVGILARNADSSLESQKSIVSQLGKIRDSISGVSLDEETTKMIEFQRNFDASARLIKTADEMLQTVLSLKD